MNRNDFAAGKVEDDAEKAKKIAEAEAEANKGKLTGDRIVGPGHASVKGTLIPDSFIKKMDSYLPAEKKKD